MTAIIGMLNKKGIAIAADSACTVTNNGNKKIVNTANKMLRLSSQQPISVMIVGSATFLRTPWDIIIRRFRQQRNTQIYHTVADCIEDFFNFIPSVKAFFPPAVQESFLEYSFNTFLDQLESSVPSVETDENDEPVNIKQILQAFRRRMKDLSKQRTPANVCPMFKEYSAEQFHKVMVPITDKVLKSRAEDASFIEYYPIEIYDVLKNELETSFMEHITSRIDDLTLLVFSGYGKNEKYPTLISAVVNDGFDNRVCYHIKSEDVIQISDERPAAICPFAQTDIIQTLINGVSPHYQHVMIEHAHISFGTFLNKLTKSLKLDDEQAQDFHDKLTKVKKDDLIRKLETYSLKRQEASLQQWLKKLVDYDLQDMACFAQNLIALTGLERRMTFGFEGVGGPIDLAIMTKKDGFTWLNRKSWYHHKDIGGRYGKFGV